MADNKTVYFVEISGVVLHKSRFVYLDCRRKTVIVVFIVISQLNVRVVL